ncbi:hypothetical protein B0T21DRAFT_393343 [Apiosordaria backusii]|uniref:F-box domain-containing protein n=1 Tax=Apiosordaria backusii TaxID=314023 RepID=A0AA40EFR1_9PEZI|nr:hypothetical protein B0T21DRAFT_393343 [Apiosordaria backusii]
MVVVADALKCRQPDFVLRWWRVVMMGQLGGVPSLTWKEPFAPLGTRFGFWQARIPPSFKLSLIESCHPFSFSAFSSCCSSPIWRYLNPEKSFATRFHHQPHLFHITTYRHNCARKQSTVYPKSHTPLNRTPSFFSDNKNTMATTPDAASVTASPTTPTLCTLLPELLLHILESIPSTATLSNFLRACPAVWRVYVKHSQSLLLRLARNRYSKPELTADDIIKFRAPFQMPFMHLITRENRMTFLTESAGRLDHSRCERVYLLMGGRGEKKGEGQGQEMWVQLPRWGELVERWDGGWGEETGVVAGVGWGRAAEVGEGGKRERNEKPVVKVTVKREKKMKREVEEEGKGGGNKRVKVEEVAPTVMNTVTENRGGNGEIRIKPDPEEEPLPMPPPRPKPIPRFKLEEDDW